MGTWDHKLLTNDRSLDELGQLTHLPVGKELMPSLAAWGVRLWFDQCKPRAFSKGIERWAKELTRLPRPLFDELAAIAQRPAEYEKRSSRKPEHVELLGRPGDGYRIEPLFALDGVKAVVAGLAERNALRLDKVLSTPAPGSLYENHLTELGVLLELTNVGVTQSAERVATWRAGFARMNAATPEEREFWDRFSERVERLFPLLSAA